MELSEKVKGDVIRLFGDEGMVASLAEICQGVADEYKDRSYRLASGSNPNLVEITQAASRGFAFENIMVVLRATFDELTEEKEDDDGR